LANMGAKSHNSGGQAAPLYKRRRIMIENSHNGRKAMKQIIIIGAGMGGMAAGIYGQINGFETTIFEAHSLPGGQCTNWTRKGYVFDGCMHYFGGGNPHSKVEAFWNELGVQPCEKAEINELISAYFPDGTSFHDYCDLHKFQFHLKQITPEDTDVIDEYIEGIKLFQKKTPWEN
jgi:phytoene dehydrogenase-like protein